MLTKKEMKKLHAEKMLEVKAVDTVYYGYNIFLVEWDDESCCGLIRTYFSDDIQDKFFSVKTYEEYDREFDEYYTYFKVGNAKYYYRDFLRTNSPWCSEISLYE